MKFQLLTFPGCPNAERARIALRDALAQERLRDAIEEIDVSSDDAPPWSKRWGSPTILIDGADAAGEASGSGEVSCRLYKDGAPSVGQIRERIHGKLVDRRRRRRRWPIVGAVLAATAASACCLVPAVLAVVGISGAGVASTLAPYRPVFLGLTAVALVAGFWFAYRPTRVVDGCGCGTSKRRRWTRAGLWSSTVLVVGIAGYPLVFDANASVHGPVRGVAEVTLRVTGMDCKACTEVLAKRLSRVPGVATVDVDYEHGRAVVTHDGKRELSTELIDAVEDVGYEATIEQAPTPIPGLR